MRFYERVLEQSVLGTLLYVILGLAGWFAMTSVAVEEYPNVAFNQISIETLWPGAAAKEVELLVTKKIEDEVEDVKGIDFIQSSSVNGFSRILVKFDEDLPDIDRAFRDMESEVRKVDDLPPLAEVPFIEKIDVEAVNPVVFVVLHGHAPEAVRRATAEELERRLEAIPGIRRVNVNGMRDHEVVVDVDPERAAAHGLTIGEVAAALEARNVAAPGGVMRGGGAEVVVRTDSEWATPEQILDAPLRPSGLRVGQLARVTSTFEQAQVTAAYSGEPANSLAIVKDTEANALDIRERVGAAVARFVAEGGLPPGLRTAFVADTTVRIRDRVYVLATNVLQGTGLVFLLMWGFLGWRMAVLATVGIGFSFLGAFVCFHWMGLSVNVLSLFGFVLVSGILVDDAIVVIENVARHHEMGKDLPTAAVDAMEEVAAPITSSVLTSVAAFAPLLLMSGTTGQFFASIPTAVIICLAFSLFEALLILPIHVAKLGTSGAELIDPEQTRFGKFVRFYKRLAGFTTKHRYATIAVAAAIVIGAFASLGAVKVVFFPSDYQFLFVNAKLPPDASLAETERALARVDEAVRSLGPDVIESTMSTAGFYYDFNYQPHINAHYGQLFVSLPRDERKHMTSKDAVDLIRNRLAQQEFGRVEIEVSELNDGPPVGRPITVRVQCDDLDELRRLAREAGEVVAGVPGVKDVQLDLEIGKREALAHIDEERAAATGLSAAAVAIALADANEGRIATRYRARDDEWDVRVRAEPEARRTLAALGNVRARNASGALIPVAQVARLELSSGFASIARYERRRTVTITGDVDLASTTSLGANQEIQRRLRPFLEREPGVAVSYAGEYEETNKSFQSLGQALLIALVAIYAILGAQFRSFVQPLVILASVPFALVGVILGLHVTGDPFTVATGLGVVGLVGVAVNDAIVLLDFANGRREKGLDAHAAIVEAGGLRLRAIFLTSVMEIGGLLPTAIGIGGRSVVWGPMATALCFGFLVQWTLTVLVTPAVYLVVDDISALAAKKTA